MTTTEGFQPATGAWDGFALATAAPLGPYAQVHLAPRFPTTLLNTALVTYLPLQGDELLLALIDGGGQNLIGRCALTTRRIYWTERDDQDESHGTASARARDRSSAHRMVVRVAGYAELPAVIGERAEPDGSFSIDLGGGATLALGMIDGRLAAALARYLETMGSAARAGAAPPMGTIDPELAARVARALPAVARVSAKGRAFSQDLHEFRSALFSGTRHVVMTPVFIGACVVVFAAMVASGVPYLSPTGEQLIRWGANQGARIVLDGEQWRLIASVFLHGGLIHLAMNMWSLLAVGPLVERLYGNLAFAVIYLASGVGGAIASFAASPRRIGVGASGAICGLLGGLVAFLIVHRRQIPKTLLKSFRGNLLSVVVLMAILGYFVPNIDQEAHLGGLATGFLSGLLFWRPWPVVKRRWVTLLHCVAPILIAVALGGLAWGVTRRATAVLPPPVRFQGIAEQIDPALKVYNAITDEAPSTLILKRDRDDADARGGHLETVRDLIRRAGSNLTALRRATTPYPPLQSMVKALVEAQSRQLAGLRAAERYLETGDPEHLSGPGGLLEEKTAAKEAIRSFQDQQYKFLLENDMIHRQSQPEA